jgi:hypothetical protein
MSITITVETGAVVTGANSFISLADFKVFCDNRGRVYGGTPAVYADEVIKAALVRAGDYLNGLQWRGRKTAQANPMCWPRCDDQIYAVTGFENITTSIGVVDKDGFIISTSTVPAQVVSAQCEAAWALLTGVDLQPNLERGGGIKREKIDVIETEYFSGASPLTRITAIEQLLSGLLRSSISVEMVRG